MTFGGSVSVYEKFEELLSQRGFTVNSLSIDTSYTFIMGSNEFSLIELQKEYLILKSLFTRVKQEKADPLLQLKDSRLIPYFVNVQDKTFNLVNKILRKKRKQMFNQFIASDLPISYFVLTHQKVYQFSTPLFDTLWAYYVHANRLTNTYNQSTQPQDFSTEASFADYVCKTLNTNKSICQFLKDKTDQEYMQIKL